MLKEDNKRVEVLLNATTRRDVTGAIIGMIGVGQVILSLRFRGTSRIRTTLPPLGFRRALGKFVLLGHREGWFLVSEVPPYCPL